MFMVRITDDHWSINAWAWQTSLLWREKREKEDIPGQKTLTGRTKDLE